MVTIVIVNWNSDGLLRDCVQSIQQFGGSCVASIVIVDNASTDQSLELVADVHEPKLKIIRNTVNIGFAAACNAGARNATSPYLLFLNPDARLLHSTLDGVCRFMGAEENSRVGILGVQLLNAAGEVARTCSRFPTASRYVAGALGIDRIFKSMSHFLVDWDHSSTRLVDQVIGAFFFVRTEVFDALGGFDERFFVYFEEVDFSLRASRSMWQSAFVAEANAFHLGNGTTDRIRATRLYYSIRSRLLFVQKHFGIPGGLVTLFSTLCIEPLTRLMHCALRGQLSEAGAVLKGYARVYRWMATGDAHVLVPPCRMPSL